ncbi:hypothetical protein [Nocardia sp. CS682]|uniref:hypothetical protein n=1 Tax=Nocardia sp. CS682 TaxID=1047172 RepID=UPI0010757EB1|nr:hypothetical protein [Nocardia sp. CS682]QBS41289.1 hypothetical protein DMB37_15330 [Nocardia sp. CS682]
MTGIDTRPVSFDTVDGELLLLDPEVERLFAEVDTILCEARARMAAPPRVPVPVPGPWPRVSLPCFGHSARLRGRPPGTGRATQRGPPPPR